MSDNRSESPRKDDIQIDLLIRDVGRLEGEVKHVKEAINAITSQINEEKEDHFYIKGRVEYVKEKLSQMEKAIIELGSSGDARAAKVEELQRDMTVLIETINKVNGILDKLNTGPHAAVHRWAERRMEIEEEQHEFKKKIVQALLTKTATIILFILLLLIAMGIVQYHDEVLEGDISLPRTEWSPF